MNSSTPVIRRLTRLALGLVFTGASVCALAANGSSSPRFTVNATLSTYSTDTAANGGGLVLNSRLVPVHVEVPVQSGAQFALMARLANSPSVCYGDTIFRNGFE